MTRAEQNRADGAPGLLKDGRSVLVRRLTPDDLDLVVDFSHRLSRRTISMRMLGPVITLDRAGLARFMNFDPDNHMALVAVHDGRAVGVADFVRVEGHPDRAEVTFTIVDEVQALGLGGLLLEHIAVAARDCGIAVLEADILAENQAMLRTLESSGYAVEYGPAGSVVHVDIVIEPSDRVVARSERREHQTVRSSMQRIFDSRTVAVVGAGLSPDNLGRAVMKNLVNHGFPGRVYAVNPRISAVMGMPTHPTVTSIGEPIDLVVVAVKADLVPDVIRDCAAASATAVIVMSVGFGETGEVGRAAEIDLIRYARSQDMRVIGPTSMGILAQRGPHRLAATFSASLPPPGVVALASQSGTLGLAVLEHARRIGLGFSSFASLGSSVDVSPNDLLQWWEEDSATTVILLDLERFGNPRKFARLTRRVSARKPIIAVTSAMRVTIAEPADGGGVDRGAIAHELFSQTGIVATRTLSEMFDVARLFANQPVPRGDRVTVVTNANQPGVLTAAACRNAGLRAATLSETTRAVLRELVPGDPVDVVDLTPRADAARYEAALRALLADDGVDSVVALFTPPLVQSREDITAALVRAGASAPSKTLVASVDGVESVLSAPDVDARSVPSYTFPEAAAAALGMATAYGAWRRQAAGVVRPLHSVSAERVRAIADRVGFGVLDAVATSELLAAAGIAVRTGTGDGLQVMVSVVNEPVFGPLIGFGVLDDPITLFGDVAFHITPVSDLDAMRMIRSVQAFPLLAECDLDALAELILRVAWLVEELPELDELRLTPVVMGVAGAGLVVREATMLLAKSRPDRRHQEARVQTR